MKNFVKKQKGITLIALIITIIVMMILVAVTINVALNGGLFDKAKTAKVGTQKEIEREQLLEAVLGAYNNQGSFVIENVKLPDDMEWADDNKTAYGSNSTATPSNNGNWVATKDGNYFYIDSYGNILDQEPDNTSDTVDISEGSTLLNVTLNNNITFGTNGPKVLTIEEYNNRPSGGEYPDDMDSQFRFQDSQGETWTLDFGDYETSNDGNYKYPHLFLFPNSNESNTYFYYWNDPNGFTGATGWYQGWDEKTLLNEADYPVFEEMTITQNGYRYSEDTYGDVFVKAE